MRQTDHPWKHDVFFVELKDGGRSLQLQAAIGRYREATDAADLRGSGRSPISIRTSTGSVTEAIT